jgi:signal transduction histidine kinase
VGWLSSITSRSSWFRRTQTPHAYSKGSFHGFWVPVLSGIAVLLAILGTLQYRWSTQIKKAAELRVGTDLESVMIKWHLDFYGEFSTVCVALQIGPDSGERDSWEDYLHRFTRWARAENTENSGEHLYTNRDLVREIYIWETSRRVDPRLLRLKADEEKIESSVVPPDLRSLLARLQRNSSNLPVALNAWESDGSRNEASGGREEPASPSHLLRSNAETGWQFDEEIPALVHPIFHYTHHRAFDTKALSSLDPVDWVVVVLNVETIQKRILPGLMQRYFRGSQGLEYKLAVIAEGRTARLLYSSDPGFGTHDVGASDSVMNIFGPPPERAKGDLWQIEKNKASLKGEDWHRFSSPVWFPVIQQTSDDGPWVLVLQNRQGPLDATVTRVWRTNVLTGGVVLLLLAASMVLVVVASQRAQSLANLQMDFVASVSHELRTPLAVILSAGENVQDGLVDGRNAFMEQGSIITEQANQLMELVDQVLRFAVTTKGTGYRSARPLQVAELIESALRNTNELLQDAGFTVEQHIPSGLPSVVGDLSALSHCLQNLIINAVKYSNRDRWIGISAGMDEGANGRNEIRISVEDHGVGISSPDLLQIFEPFYRSPQAIAAQIHGTGLGLSIAKRNAEAFGGKLSVVSEVGVGSVFTLHLPILKEDSELATHVPEAEMRLPQ